MNNDSQLTTFGPAATADVDDQPCSSTLSPKEEIPRSLPEAKDAVPLSTTPKGGFNHLIDQQQHGEHGLCNQDCVTADVTEINSQPLQTSHGFDGVEEKMFSSVQEAKEVVPPPDTPFNKGLGVVPTEPYQQPPTPLTNNLDKQTYQQPPTPLTKQTFNQLGNQHFSNDTGVNHQPQPNHGFTGFSIQPQLGFSQPRPQQGFFTAGVDFQKRREADIKEAMNNVKTSPLVCYPVSEIMELLVQGVKYHNCSKKFKAAVSEPIQNLPIVYATVFALIECIWYAKKFHSFTDRDILGVKCGEKKSIADLQEELIERFGSLPNDSSTKILSAHPVLLDNLTTLVHVACGLSEFTFNDAAKGKITMEQNRQLMLQLTNELKKAANDLKKAANDLTEARATICKLSLDKLKLGHELLQLKRYLTEMNQQLQPNHGLTGFGGQFTSCRSPSPIKPFKFGPAMTAERQPTAPFISQPPCSSSLSPKEEIPSSKPEAKDAVPPTTS